MAILMSDNGMYYRKKMVIHNDGYWQSCRHHIDYIYLFFYLYANACLFPLASAVKLIHYVETFVFICKKYV